jgi:hypothetical protein
MIDAARWVQGLSKIRPCSTSGTAGTTKALNSFPSTTPPTEMFSGSNELFTGSMYFNTASGSVYVWDGSNWLDGFGTSGTSGVSGTSGTGFSTINNPGDLRLLFSDGTTNAATASTYMIVSQSLNSSSISLGVGTLNISNEANIFLGGRTVNEGGQLVLQSAFGYNTASMIDNYQDAFRVLKGNNTSSNAVDLQIYHTTGQIQFPNYTTTASFVGTPVGVLSFDSNGNVLTNPTKFVSNAIGNTVQSIFSITHNLGTLYPSVLVVDTSTSRLIYPTVDTSSGSPEMFHASVVDGDRVSLNFASAPGTGQFRVIVNS